MEAFYLSNDRPALAAVYGEDSDLTEHAEWVEILKACGDAGQLGKMFTFTVNLSVPAAAASSTALSAWRLPPARGS